MLLARGSRFLNDVSTKHLFNENVLKTHDKCSEAATVVYLIFRFKEVNMMSVTLSSDHRVVDGAIGAKFLQVLRENLEDPVNMIL